MIARLMTSATVAAWTAYLTHATTAAVHPHVGPLPHGLRTAVPITLLLLAGVAGSRWLLAQLRTAHGLDIQPRWDGPPGDPGCRNTPPPEPVPPRPTVYTGQVVGGDDSPTIDYGYGPGIVRLAGERALMFAPPDEELWRVLRQLREHAQGRGWDPCGFTRDWQEMMRLLGSGAYELGVVPSMSALDPARMPRIVAVDEPPALERGASVPVPRGLRPRRLPRQGG